MLLRRAAAYVTSAILPIRNVYITSLPIARIVLILKVELLFADHTCFCMSALDSSTNRLLRLM